MQTEPEQWAVELMEAALAVFCENTTEDGALVIQRAFEERERKLREAASELLSAQDAIDNWRGVNEGTLWIRALSRRQAALLALSQALKETPDAQ